MKKSELNAGQYTQENIRSNFNQSIDELQKSYLTDEPKDNFIYDYVGKVVSNSDPLKLGRVKIRVYNIFDDTIPDSDLPYALPENNVTDGSFCIPSVGSIVGVRFDRGVVYTPIYTSRVSQIGKVPKQALKGYPNNVIVYETDLGDYLSINRLTGETLIEHRSKSTIRISPLGEIEINAKIVKIKGDVDNPIGGGAVVPNAAGGNFCSISICPVTGIFHQGYIALNT